jgi:hypothetical protein
MTAYASNKNTRYSLLGGIVYDMNLVKTEIATAESSAITKKFYGVIPI